MLEKILIILVLLVVIYCLASALFFLAKGEVDSIKMVKALTWRIVLSLLLFGFIILSYFLGWITPHGITPNG